MNPLDWKGPEFLSLYAMLLAGGFLVAVILRHFLRLPSGAPLRLGRRVDPYEAAALDSPDTLIEAAVGALFHRRTLRIVGRKIATDEALPAEAAPIERSVFECAAAGNTTMADLRRALSPDVRHYQKRLAKKGLVVNDAQALWVQVLPSLVYGAVLLLGLAKILVGISRDKPVLFLVLLVGVGSLALFYLAHRPWRSRLGDATLEDLREEHQPLRTTAMAAGSTRSLSGQDVALAVALFGPAMLLPMGYTDLRQALRPTSTASGDGTSSGDTDYDSDLGDIGGSSCSSGSSSCGGGGGGGGGCGGCGGGGD